MAIEAEFVELAQDQGEARAARRQLRLTADAASRNGPAPVLIHNISATGLLLEAAAAPEIGQTLAIDLPQVGPTSATVVWRNGDFAGCEFAAPISPAALSAASLQSAPIAAEPFGIRLNRLRRERGLTLARIAAQLGVSKPTVWAWEQGKARPVEGRLDALAAALGVTRAALQPSRDHSALGDVLARSRAAIAAEYGTTPDRVRIMVEL